MILALGRINMNDFSEDNESVYSYTSKKKKNVKYRKWDFKKIRGKSYGSSNEDERAGICGLGTKVCKVPPTQIKADFRVVPDEKGKTLIAAKHEKTLNKYFNYLKKNKNEWGKKYFERGFERALDFRMVTTGDDNWDMDCRHQGITIQLKVDFIDSGLPPDEGKDGPDKIK